MKSKRTTIQFCILVLALTAQLSFISPSATAQNTNSSTTMQNDNTGIPYNRACRRRCDNSYRRCIRSGKNRTACRKQLRNCLRRCPQ